MSILRLVFPLASVLASLPLVAAPLKIACIGDSITEGSGLPNPTLESYPAKLSRLLGTNYIVRNFGVSGRTLLKSGDFPYWKHTNFKTSHDWLPDVVIIQLGTNDGKPYNWRYGTNFVVEYEELVASYASLSNAPQVIACTPCPVYGKGAFDINPGTVGTNIAPAIRAVAARAGLELIDLQVRLAGHAELFPDTVHPNSKGTTVMAAVMWDELFSRGAEQPDAELTVHRSTTTRIGLIWPAASRALVPQFTSALAGSNTVWSVSEPVIYLDGDWVRQTNSIPGAKRFYRLWQP